MELEPSYLTFPWFTWANIFERQTNGSQYEHVNLDIYETRTINPNPTKEMDPIPSLVTTFSPQDVFS